MRARFIILVPLLVAAVSCDRFADDSLKDSGRLFYASFEQSSDTKAFADATFRVAWTKDDRIAVFNKNQTNQPYRFNGATGENYGSFSPVNDNVIEGSLPFAYAVYPYSGNEKLLDEGMVSLEMPGEQTYLPDTFGPDASPMLAVTDSDHLQFYNIGGILLLRLYGADVDIRKVTVKGRKGELLSGQACASIHPGMAPVVKMSSDAFETVSSISSTDIRIGSSKDDATAFWLSIPPTLFSDGFEVTLYDSRGRRGNFATSRSINVQRNHVVRMSPLQVILSEFPVEDYPPDEFWGYDSVTSFNLVLVGYTPEFFWTNSNRTSFITTAFGYSIDGCWDCALGRNFYSMCSGYPEDYGWGMAAGGNLNHTGSRYGSDDNWDGDGHSNMNPGGDGYGDDKNWNTPGAGNPGIDGSGYGEDQKWK